MGEESYLKMTEEDKRGYLKYLKGEIYHIKENTKYKEIYRDCKLCILLGDDEHKYSLELIDKISNGELNINNSLETNEIANSLNKFKELFYCHKII